MIALPLWLLLQFGFGNVPVDCVSGPVAVNESNWPQPFPISPASCEICLSVAIPDPAAPGGTRIISGEVCGLDDADYASIKATRTRIQYCGLVTQPTWESLGVEYSRNFRFIITPVARTEQCRSTLAGRSGKR